MITDSAGDSYEDATAHAFDMKQPSTVDYAGHQKMALGAANDNEPPSPFPDVGMQQMQIDVSKIKDLSETKKWLESWTGSLRNLKRPYLKE